MKTDDLRAETVKFKEACQSYVMLEMWRKVGVISRWQNKIVITP